ncbi:MAG TPA: transposase [Ktedonobacteraceae bacterium]
MAQRAERERTTGRRTGGRPPTPPVPGPRDGDHRPSRRQSARQRRRRWTLAIGVLPPRLRVPGAGSNPPSLRIVIPIIRARQQRFSSLPDPPPEDASALVKMAYKLKTTLGKAIYGARTCTVEPVIGIIKEVLGFRQFSLRGTQAAAGEWCLVCLAFHLKRFHTFSWAEEERGTRCSARCLTFSALFCQKRRFVLLLWSMLPTRRPQTQLFVRFLLRSLRQAATAVPGSLQGSEKISETSAGKRLNLSGNRCRRKHIAPLPGARAKPLFPRPFWGLPSSCGR